MRSLFVLFCLQLLVWQQAVAQGPADRPNVLIIIADDMSPTAGIYGDRAVATPAIDKLGKNGIVFQNAFCAAPSCTASRASILTGRHPHELKEGGNLWSTLSVAYPNYTTLLAANGYRIGLTGKGWGPGNFKEGGYAHNPAGPAFESFDTFLTMLNDREPFCFWLGSMDPHRPYDAALYKNAGTDKSKIVVPSWLPDNTIVRKDLLDYYAEVNRFDETVNSALTALKESGRFENTLIIITSDNGMPFPRAKANVYDAGSKVPLIMRWGDRFRNDTRCTELVTLMDISPTVLDAADIPIPSSVTGKSLLPLLVDGNSDGHYEAVFIERERHAYVRKDGLSYPMRAIRTNDYLYILNLRPDRWPAGDPGISGARSYGDVDNGLSKAFLVDHQHDSTISKLAQLSFGKRQAEELFDLARDPGQLINIVDDPAYREVKERLQLRLAEWRKTTHDPVTEAGPDIFDDYPYYGGGRMRK